MDLDNLNQATIEELKAEIVKLHAAFREIDECKESYCILCKKCMGVAGHREPSKTKPSKVRYLSIVKNSGE